MAQTRVPVDGFNTALQAVLARMPNTTSSQLANLRAAQRVIAERCDEIERAMPKSISKAQMAQAPGLKPVDELDGRSNEVVTALSRRPDSPSRDHFDDLSDDVATVLLARVPFTTHGTIRCVCSRFQSLLDLPAFHKQRVGSKYAEHGLIIVGGGRVGREEIFAAGGYLLLGGRWRRIAPTIHPRNCHGAVMFNGELVVMGGYRGGVRLRSVEAYNVRTNSWRSLPPMSRARDHPVAAAIGDFLVVIGSPDQHARTIDNWHAGNDELDDEPVSAEAYGSATNSWKALPSMPHPGKDFACALNDRLYVLAGRKLQMFDFNTNSWTVLADMPIPDMYDNRHWYTASDAVVHEGKIMVIRGVNRYNEDWGSGIDRALDVVYDPEADAWTNSPHPLPSPRGRCVAMKLDGEIAIITRDCHGRRDGTQWHGPALRFRGGVWETFAIPPMHERNSALHVFSRSRFDHSSDAPNITGLLIG